MGREKHIFAVRLLPISRKTLSMGREKHIFAMKFLTMGNI
jgi:hypothetical protein